MFSGSLVAIVTPMHSDGSIDLPAWDRLLTMHLEAGTSAVVVCGTTGESPTVSDAETMQLVERARQRLKGRAALIVGAGTNSTADTVEAFFRCRGRCAADCHACLQQADPGRPVSALRSGREGFQRTCGAV